MSCETLAKEDVIRMCEELDKEPIVPKHFVMRQSDYKKLRVFSCFEEIKKDFEATYGRALDGIIDGKDLTPEEAFCLCNKLSLELMEETDSDMREVQRVLIRAHIEALTEEQKTEIEARLVYSDL